LNAKPNLVAMTTRPRNGCQGFADEFFVDERPVDLGGVEERDAAFDGGADECDVVGPVEGGAVALSHAHGVEADGRDLQSGAEGAFAHGECSFGQVTRSGQVVMCFSVGRVRAAV
jgi:hypothetical protein